MTRAATLARHRHLWSLVNERVTAAEADRLWSSDEPSWGLFRHPDRELGLLDGVRGLHVVELGCGTAYLSAWLARAGAHVTALDLSREQLRTAQACQARYGRSFPLVEADGEVLPLRDRCADLVVSEYGVAPWCDPVRWLAEAARVLRPGGRLVFLTHSALVAMCVPAHGGVAGDRLLRGPDDLAPVDWPDGGTEHHPAHGAWIRLLRDAGFEIEALHELTPPPGATDHDAYEIVTVEWARRWPAEDLWCARRSG